MPTRREVIADEVGYQDVSFLNRLWRKAGLRPAEYSRRFGSLARLISLTV